MVELNPKSERAINHGRAQNEKSVQFNSFIKV